MRGSRVQAVVNELQGEKIDIVLWSEDTATFVVNALGPAEVDKVVIEEELKKIDIIVPDEQLSLAIGRRGQNVRLASSVTGSDIDILTISEESEKRNEEFKKLSQIFISSLDVDERFLSRKGQMQLQEQKRRKRRRKKRKRQKSKGERG